MVSRIGLVFVMLFTLALNTFSQVAYKIVNNEIVFSLGGPDIKYTLGTKTAEYVMGYLANSNYYTTVAKKNVTYDSITYPVVLFGSSTGGSEHYYKIGFLRANDGTDIIKLYFSDAELSTFKIKPSTTSENVLKVDYVIGQIVKWMTTMVWWSGNQFQQFCLNHITIDADGIPTSIDFVYGPCTPSP